MPKPFSSILKHSAVSASCSQINSRNKRSPIPLSAPFSSSPPSNHVTSSNLVPPYSKAHRDLLLEPHGRPLSLAEDYPNHFPPFPS